MHLIIPELDSVGLLCLLALLVVALIRLDDAISILEYVVGMREEKLGTANPDVDDERQRLAVLLKEAGKVRARKSRPLEALLENSLQLIKGDGIAVV